MFLPRVPNPRTACVVAGDNSAGVLVGPALYASGYNVVHVRNCTEPDPDTSYAAGVFSGLLEYHGDLQPIVTALRSAGVCYVLPGAEEGVGLADLLAGELGLKCANPAASMPVRRDKLRMIEALRDAGVPHAQFARVATAEEALAWAEREGRWPVVVKPRQSAGGDGVHICRDASELRDAVTKLIGSTTVFTTTIDSLLIEDFLDGPEYMVNAVSAHGTHRVRSMLRSEKRQVNGRPVYDHAYLIDPASDAFREIEAYTVRVLDALQVRYGASHTELIMTSRGPILLETGARLQGRLDPSAFILATGAHPVFEMVRSYVDPDGLLAATAVPPERRAHYRMVMLSSARSGTLLGELPWPEIEGLPSFHNRRSKAAVGGPVSTTVDLFSSIAGVHLVHSDADQIERDHEWLRQFEATRLPQLIG